jgi:heme-degrading monooxygenase HmoA
MGATAGLASFSLDRQPWSMTSFVDVMLIIEKGASMMIARTWRGVTPESKADQYFDYLMATGVKDLEATEGNQGVLVLRSVSNGQAEFLLTSFWESFEAIRRFAGDNVDIAVYYPEDKDYLLELEPKVKHFEVLHTPSVQKN